MNQIVKAETAPTMSQATASASVLIALIVVLAGLGMAAALQVGSVASVVLAVVVARSSLDRSHSRLSLCGARERHAPHPRQRDTTKVSRFFVAFLASGVKRQNVLVLWWLFSFVAGALL